jgi:hypothetical protein
MSKLRFRYDRLVEAVSGGGVYQSRWMSGLGIPPVPAWTVFKNWLSARAGRLRGYRPIGPTKPR